MQELVKNLFFVGIKHSGKTTFASRSAQLLSVPFSDSDELIKAIIEGESVRDYYRREGKEAFMEKEYAATKSFIEKEKPFFILSLGGGASDNTPLMELLKEKGAIIYLNRKEEDMLPVILKHGIPAFLDKDDPASSFHALYEKRDKIYRDFADITIDLGPYGDKDETEEYILSVLKEKGYVR